MNDAVHAIKLGAATSSKPLARSASSSASKNVPEAAQTRRALAEVCAPAVAALRDDRAEPRDATRSSTTSRRWRHEGRRLSSRASSTGKELISRAIHRLSQRTDGPFVKVNCAAIPRELIESELFGHERGAFTGAQARKRGFFEQAHGGTLFLDEIGDMDLVAQAKVLRALQSGEISRVGSEHVMHVDVRVLAATNKDLSKEVERQTFREDLYYRLNVFPIRSPALRERVEDIPLLAESFVLAFARENGTKKKPMAPDVLRALAARRWPGNVRELKNVVERMAILSGSITIADLPEDPHEPLRRRGRRGRRRRRGGRRAGRRREDEAELTAAATSGAAQCKSYMTLREYREYSERKYIVDTLKLTGWNISRTGRPRRQADQPARRSQLPIKRGEG